MTGSGGTPRPRRPRHAMPADIREALRTREVWEAFQNRPPYQRNDYVGWITRAKQPATRQRRLDQMLDELASGDRYMKMAYRANGEQKDHHRDAR